MEQEVFRKIWFSDYYEVSNLGRVKSLKRGGVLYLKPTKDNYGYTCFSFWHNGKPVIKKLHQLLAVAFLGHTPCGYKIIVDHIDNDQTNNNLDNLQLITQRENASKDARLSNKYTGVSWNKREQKFRAYITIDGKQRHLGYFKKEIDGHKAYQKKLKSIL